MQNGLSREADHPEEILDLVDENDSIVGSATRKEVYAQGLRNYRVVHAFIINSEGKIWTPKRSVSKKLYPGGLDYSIAGHVESGESYEEALHKEAREEVSLDLKNTPYKEVGHFNPYTDNVHCFQRVYEIQSNVDPNYNKDDFSGYEWLSPQEIITRWESGVSMKGDIPEVLKICYSC